MASHVFQLLKLISIHAPREGGDDFSYVDFEKFSYFNPRPPRGGRHRRGRCSPTAREDFNPRPPRGGRRGRRKRMRKPLWISIHAPREGGDNGRIRICIPLRYFNPRPPRGGRPCKCHCTRRPPLISIHAPREGGDGVFDLVQARISAFQSTPPARGATLHTRQRQRFSILHFNPRPPRGGRRCQIPTPARITLFQSTPPARGATGLLHGSKGVSQFQSTPPARGATAIMDELDEGIKRISIHAPREGGDQN